MMNEQVTDEIKVTPEMIDACRNVLEKWEALESIASLTALRSATFISAYEKALGLL